MSMVENYNVELFEVQEESIKQIRDNLLLSELDVYIPKKTQALFRDRVSCLWALADTLSTASFNCTVHEKKPVNNLIVVGEVSPNHIAPFFVEDDSYNVSFNKVKRYTVDLDADFVTFRRIVGRQLKMKLASPLKSSGWDIYDESINLAASAPRRANLTKHVRINRGVSTSLRQYGHNYFFQVYPKARITLDSSLDRLVQEQAVSLSDVSKLFSIVTLPSGKKGRIAKILDQNASDKILSNPIYSGKNYLEFAKLNYPSLQLVNPNSPLVLVSSGSIANIHSLEALSASLTFTTLSFWDEAFFSSLIKIFRLESAQRLDQAVEWIDKILPIKFENYEFKVSSTPLNILSLREPLNLDKEDISGDIPGATLRPPAITVLKEDPKSPNGFSEFDLIPGFDIRYKGIVNDLMRNKELRPLLAPHTAKLIVFVQQELTSDWNTLKSSLQRGTQDYRGLLETFGVDTNFKEVPIADFESPEFETKLSKVEKKEYDCAIVIIPRSRNDLGKSRRLYVEPKTKIMKKGIPVQVIVDEKRNVEGRENTLLSKARNGYACFGIVLNILIKIGAVIAALSPSVSEKILPRSVVIGYNVDWVYPRQEDLSTFMYPGRKTIPLAAPLVIFDNRGAQLIHQYVYQIEPGSSLFEQHGRAILSRVPSGISSVVVHKEGMLYPDEIRALQVLTSNGLRIIPISIISSQVPRIFNPTYSGTGFQLRAGTFLHLSEDDILITTTPVYNWDYQRSGWPCPILIHFHEEVSKLTPEEKIYLINQVYALTKLQTGSQRATREPISLHYSNMIMRFIKKVGDAFPEYLHYFSPSDPNQKFIPKWYP